MCLPVMTCTFPATPFRVQTGVRHPRTTGPSVLPDVCSRDFVLSPVRDGRSPRRNHGPPESLGVPRRGQSLSRPRPRTASRPYSEHRPQNPWVLHRGLCRTGRNPCRATRRCPSETTTHCTVLTVVFSPFSLLIFPSGTGGPDLPTSRGATDSVEGSGRLVRPTLNAWCVEDRTRERASGLERVGARRWIGEGGSQLGPLGLP